MGEIHLLACLLASIFHVSFHVNFPHEFTEKCFAVFDQSSYTIYLTWYQLLLLFREFSSIIPFMVRLKILVKSMGEGTILFLALSVNIWQK